MKKLLFTALLIIILLTGFMLVFSLSTSPLYPHNFSYDSAFFRLFGSEILKGRTPYKDIWDHKGPVLFFIQALGAAGWITGNNKGLNILFLLQIISLSLSVIFLYQTYCNFGNQNHNRLKFIGIMICALSVFSLTIESGNLSEEWCIPMICCSIFLMMKFAVHTDSSAKHPRKYAFLHGLCLGAIIMIRMNNAIPICAGLIIIGIYLIIKKQWKNLVQNILSGIFGIMCILIPIFGWFKSRDALQEMIYAVFTFNFKYIHVRSYIPYTGEPFITRYLPIAAAGSIFLIYLIRKHKIELADWITAAILAASIWMLMDTNIYLHYYTIFIPVYFLVMMRCANQMKLPESLILLFVLSWFIILNIQRIPDLAALHRQGPMFTAAQQIPEEERDSVIAVNLPPEIYLNYGLTPVSRFCAYQHVHFAIDPDMKVEFLDTLSEKKPQWILAFCSGETKIPEVQSLIEIQYQYKFDQSDVCYYHRK